MIDGGSSETHRGGGGGLADVGAMLRDRRVELKQDIKTMVVLHLTHRVVIVGQRMYQMILTTADGRKSDATQFFDSLQLDETARKKDD